MISIKSGTQTWSNSQQENTLKADSKETLTASEREKHYGGKSLEEILNKAADPNWVDPAKNPRRVGNANLDKDAFLKLFLAHLKNQDPTNPQDSHAMAAQLAQFTSLEKLENIDDGIKNIVKANDKKAKGSYDALQLIGKGIAGDSSKIIRSDVDETHEIPFEIASDATEAKVEILDAGNQVIKTLDIAKLKAGKNKVDWAGMNEEGAKVPEGEYRVRIEAKASNGKKLLAETKFDGVVTGVNYTSQGPVLMLGRKMIKLSEVKKIFESNELKQRPVHEAKAMEKPGANKPVAAPVQSAEQKSQMGQVGMSRGLVNQLAKKTGHSHGIN